MNGVEYLSGSEMVDNTPMQPYSNEICDFVGELSSVLMKSPVSRQYTDIASFAFWCRKGNIHKLKTACTDASYRLGRGLCFHIAPSNIPINFAFSWLFSLLAGNANIVRLSSKEYPQLEPVVGVIRKTIAKYPEIDKRNAFIRYSANNETTVEFSKNADCRMIWGGDDTIAKIKSLPVKPRCIDLCFADRYSLCIMNGQAVLDADDTALKRLALNFYNDTYLMDQNACSSPQLILWTNESAAARKRLWNAVYDCAAEKYDLQAAVAVDKYVHMCEDAIDMDILDTVEHMGNLLYCAEMKALRPDMERFRGKGGYFYEYSLKSLDELLPIVTEKYQTLTQFGMDENALRTFVIENRLRGIDRIVPVGKAMDIGIIWDGFDLVRVLSRIVNAE